MRTIPVGRALDAHIDMHAAASRRLTPVTMPFALAIMLAMCLMPMPALWMRAAMHCAAECLWLFDGNDLFAKLDGLADVLSGQSGAAGTGHGFSSCT